jgi:hypothetical protein
MGVPLVNLGDKQASLTALRPQVTAATGNSHVVGSITEQPPKEMAVETPLRKPSSAISTGRVRALVLSTT